MYICLQLIVGRARSVGDGPADAVGRREVRGSLGIVKNIDAISLPNFVAQTSRLSSLPKLTKLDY